MCKTFEKRGYKRTGFISRGRLFVCRNGWATTGEKKCYFSNVLRVLFFLRVCSERHHPTEASDRSGWRPQTDGTDGIGRRRSCLGSVSWTGSGGDWTVKISSKETPWSSNLTLREKNINKEKWAHRPSLFRHCETETCIFFPPPKSFDVFCIRPSVTNHLH